MMRLRHGNFGGGARPPAFFAELLKHLNATRIPFLVGGTYALNAYLDIRRVTKDIDIFCRPSDYPRILASAAERGYRTEVEDERWIAKVRPARGHDYCDVIFCSANMVTAVTDAWFTERNVATVVGVRVKLLPVTELIWSKIFIMDRVKYDAGDIAHLILRRSELINWKRLLGYAELHWEVLLLHLLHYRYVYPSERDHVPRWLLNELLGRLKLQLDMPPPHKKVCRGRIFSRDDYEIDITEWGFADLVGDDKF